MRSLELYRQHSLRLLPGSTTLNTLFEEPTYFDLCKLRPKVLLQRGEEKEIGRAHV